MHCHCHVQDCYFLNLLLLEQPFLLKPMAFLLVLTSYCSCVGFSPFRPLQLVMCTLPYFQAQSSLKASMLSVLCPILHSVQSPISDLEQEQNDYLLTEWIHGWLSGFYLHFLVFLSSSTYVCRLINLQQIIFNFIIHGYSHIFYYFWEVLSWIRTKILWFNELYIFSIFKFNLNIVLNKKWQRTFRIKCVRS